MRRPSHSACLWARGAGVILLAAASHLAHDSELPMPHGQIVAGALDGMARVGLSGRVSTLPAIQLFAARGEYEPFEVVVDAQNGAVELVSVAVSDLRSDHNVIERSNLAVFREHFIHLRRGSRDFGGPNRPLGPGMYPDALIPVSGGGFTGRLARFVGSPVTVEPGTHAVFWIDAFVPREAAPGLYRGVVTVFGRNAQAVISVSLVVWRHTLPLRPFLKSSFGMEARHMGDERMAELLLAHRLMPFLIRPERAKYYEEKFGLNTTGLPFFGNGNTHTCTMNPPPPVKAIRDAMARYPKDIETYEYAADEIDGCPSMFPVLKQWSRNVHEAGAKMLVTVTPGPELFSDDKNAGRHAVDIWVLLPKMYVDAYPLVQQVLRTGDEVWSYNALVQDGYSPKWEIDFDPIDYRIQAGFLSQSLGITGLLYSEVNHWNDDPWSNPDSLDVDEYAFNGEDMLVYPGEPAGSDEPLPSMRLKWLRKGVEDYDYVEMLKQAGRGDWALQTIRTVASDWHSWTRNTAALESVRRKLGEELDRIAAANTASAQSRDRAPSS